MAAALWNYTPVEPLPNVEPDSLLLLQQFLSKFVPRDLEVAGVSSGMRLSDIQQYYMSLGPVATAHSGSAILSSPSSGRNKKPPDLGNAVDGWPCLLDPGPSDWLGASDNDMDAETAGMAEMQIEASVSEDEQFWRDHGPGVESAWPEASFPRIAMILLASVAVVIILLATIRQSSLPCKWLRKSNIRRSEIRRRRPRDSAHRH